ncbi:hypothetical protein FKR81_13345 [Lentzea tibetensis]|uniref:Uncharacterized protein n=2 Tax=Lentzea tibetensis TaxID=2591470 RepID=A0A563EW78_9PSEU|nr:hypothetical protein FKR81_13345 [Lentzea tibetensis]
MAHFATQAANAESEAEAEAFLGALIPLAAKVLPKAMPVIRKFGPQLIKGVAKVGRQLWNRPETRQLVKAVPSAVLKTAGDLAGQWADGKDISARRAIGTFGKNMADTLGAGKSDAVRATNQLNRRH